MSTEQRESDDAGDRAGTVEPSLPGEQPGPSGRPDHPAQEPAPPGPPDETAEEPVSSGPPEDQRWAAFAPEPERTQGRLRRAAARLGRGLAHEWTLAVLASLALAVALTWPALRHPRYTLPQDLGDPTLVAWLLSWPGHILLTDPGQLWHGNAFYPERWSYAFTDSLLGYAPFGLVGEGPLAAALRYNILYVLIAALAFFGAYALARQLGATPTGAAVAAAAFAYAPWRLTQAGHLHVISTGGIALSLAMLARGHGWSLRHGFRPERVRPGWIIGGWLVAAWQVTLGFGVGLMFAYALLLVAVVVVVGWVLRRLRRRPRQPVGRLLGANLIGGSVFAAVAVLMALPYLTVLRLHPHAQRSIAEVEMFSPPLRGFLVAPAESWLWGAAHADARAALSWPPEMALLPGFALLGLATAGLFFSVWSVRTRLCLAGGVAGTVILAMGTEFADGALYRPLYELLPGWDGLRTPGRLVIWTTLLLGVLAAGTVSALVARARELARHRGSPYPGGWLRLAAVLPLVLVLVEGLNTTPHVVVPPQPAALASVEGPVLVLPSDQLTDMQVMMWTTDRFVPLVNGGSGFVPQSLAETRQVTATFPDQASVSHLRSLGVATVVVLPDRVVGTPWEGALYATGAEFGVTREEIDGVIVFHL